ncbi:MAG: hypothetical protein ABT940_02810 [Alphaproteobacteria bacterium]
MKLSHGRVLFGFAAVLASVPGVTHASEVSDISREFKVSQAVVETVVSNIDAYFASAGAPGNRMVTGLLKELSLKATRNRIDNLEGSSPGKVSETSSEEKDATYKVSVKTVRHDTAETKECVENKATVVSTEGVPIVRDGTFVVDTSHPRVTSHSWNMTFCRAPLGGGSGYSDWQLSPAGK